MGGLREWLRKFNMEQYADAFEQDDIDLDILEKLTEQDFVELGVSRGNRRRLMTAIAMRSGEAAGAEQTPAVETSSEAERRQVTVLFCDLVGSTQMSVLLDPEILATLIRRYQDAVAGAIGRYGGFVAKFMGDGVLAYFGFPRAYEDAAERAVRAALATVAEVMSIARPDGPALQTRIGVATGLVVVGEIVGEGAARESAIVGQTPNLAARLQALAAPDGIMISAPTERLLGGMFELEAAGEHDLKGFAQPVPVWRVRGEAVIDSRFAATRPQIDTPIIGRTHEMGLLLDRWRLAERGEGQIVTVSGEAGIGKSRLVEGLHDALAAAPYARLHWQCSPYHSDSALYPVIQYLNRAARCVAQDKPEAKLEKFRALFATRFASDPAALGVLGELLSLPLAEGAPPLSLTPAQQRAATIALLNEEIVRLAEAQPVLLVLEDAHWSDATTLELMTRIADSTGAARMLVLATGRPEFAPPWQARPHATLLTLARLSQAESTKLVAGVAAAHGLSLATVAAIVAKTDGVPLFIEEVTRNMMEQAGEDGAAVPTTLKDSLMARLDRLGEAREVAQIAAAIGRQFTFALLGAVVAKGDGALDPALTTLIEAGIIFPEGRGGERSFSFKHALVRDAAYESLRLTRRREWHERIARALEERFPGIVANEPELLAHHFGEARLASQTCDYRMRAGDRAVSQSAHEDAIAHFSLGLRSADALPETERVRRELDFLMKLGAAQTLALGPHSFEVANSLARAGEIAERVGDDAATYQAKWGLWYHASSSSKLALSRQRASELMALAERSHDDGFMLEARHCRFSTAFICGDVAGMVEDGRIGAESYDMRRHRHLGPAFAGHDPGVCAHLVMGVGLQMSGDREQAYASGERGIALAEKLDNPVNLVHALATHCILCQSCGDREATLATVRRMAAPAEKLGMYWYSVSIPLYTAWATAAGRDSAEAARLIDAEIDKVIALGSAITRHYLCVGAEVLLAAARPSDALALLDRAIALTDEPGVGLYLPEVYRLRGKCLSTLDRANVVEARAAFGLARNIAERQGAIIFARRAEAALAETTR